MEFRDSKDLNKAAKRCLYYIDKMERDDFLDNDVDIFIARLIGVFTVGISYQEAITLLCLTGHGLNSSTLVRSQLEAFLILFYLIESDDLDKVAQRVVLYEDWVMIKMYLNSKKSGTYELFTINKSHREYLEHVEANYLRIKAKYSNNETLFKELEKSQSFLKNKRDIAVAADIEDLYNAVFSETSATVHIADISDRMMEVDNDYEYRIYSSEHSMMMTGLSNILLVKSIVLFTTFFKFSKETKKKIFKNVRLAKSSQAHATFKV